MPHGNKAIENVCRVCHATAPKASLKKIQSFQANWLLIPYNFKECICSSCHQKYENYKNSTFTEVKIHFGYHEDQNLPDVRNCSTHSKCIYCSELDRWRVVETMPESKDKRKAEREFFRQLIDVRSTTLALTPLSVKNEPQNGIYRLEYRQSKTNYIYCMPCDKILNYANSNNRGLRSHQSFQEHGANGSSQIPQQQVNNQANEATPSRKIMTLGELSDIRQLLARGVQTRYWVLI